MKTKVLLYSIVVAGALFVSSGQRVSAVGVFDRTGDTYAYQSDNGTHYGSATRTVALHSVSNVVCRTVSNDAKKNLHRFVFYFNSLTPSPEAMWGGGVSIRAARWPMAQGVRLAFLRTIRI